MKEYYLNLYTKTRDEYFDYLKSLLLREEKKVCNNCKHWNFYVGYRRQRNKWHANKPK